MKVVNKELGILVDMSERQAAISLKRNPRKYTLPESVEEIELDEDDEEPVKPKGQTPKQAESVQEVAGSVIESGAKESVQIDPEPATPKAHTESIEDVNAKADASKGAIALANENGINLNDIGITGRIMKTDVENYLNSK